MSSGRDIGLGHEAHPLLGKRVLDSDSGRIGILRAIAPEDITRGGVRVNVRRAWIAPESGGGVEWTTAPDSLKEADR